MEKTSLKHIPVYRQNQLALLSPCLLGDLCDVCKAHARCRQGRSCRACRRGQTRECERAYAAPAAFTVNFAQALSLVRHGLAEFILRGAALRLTFSKLAHLRDQSLRIDERFLMAYAQGDRRARAIIDDPGAGWSARIPVVQVPSTILEAQERVLYFG